MIWVINLIAVKPYIAELKYFNGMRHNVDKNYTKSLPNFQYAVQLYPYNGRILHALGATYYNLNEYKQAICYLQEAKKYMIDVNTFYVLGLSYSKLNMYKKEEEEFKQAIYLNPKFTKAYVDLAYLYAKQEEYDKAIVEWNKLLEINPDFPEKYNVLYFMGMAYQKKQMPDKALEYFLQAIQLVPEGDPIEQEIEEEINKIYRSNLEN
jgi:tetratricopeptide (TPR) repeat protein